MIANDDAKGMIAEALEVGAGKRWDVPDALGNEILEAYRRRTFDTMDEATRKNLLRRAQNDINNIISGMSPLGDSIILYRNVLPRKGITYSSGSVVEMKSISSCSLTPCNESYRHEKSFFRYVIQVPKGVSVLRMDTLEPYLRNEPDEVLLPPSRLCRFVAYINCRFVAYINRLDKT